MKALTILMIWTLFVLIIGAISVIVMNRAFIMNRKKGRKRNANENIDLEGKGMGLRSMVRREDASTDRGSAERIVEHFATCASWTAEDQACSSI